MRANDRNVDLNTKGKQKFACICSFKGSYLALGIWILWFRRCQPFPFANYLHLLLFWCWLFFPHMCPFFVTGKMFNQNNLYCLSCVQKDLLFLFQWIVLILMGDLAKLESYFHLQTSVGMNKAGWVLCDGQGCYSSRNMWKEGAKVAQKGSKLL